MRVTTYSVAQANKSHRAFAKVTLLRSGTEQSTALRVTGGSVSVDASAAVRRRCRLTLAGYHPEIDPFSCELKVWRSFNDEYVPLGVFRVEDPTVNEGRDGVTTEIEGYDRAYWLSSLRLVTPYTIAAGTTVDAAIQALLASRAPSLPFSFISSPYTVPATTFEEQSDPWDKALSLAEAAGLELFLDPDGVCVLRTPRTADVANVVATFGQEARILKAGRKQSTKATYSHAIATGENTNVASPLRSEAMDTDPTSPTYYLGPFGDRPTWLRSQFITTQQQADDAARALLARSSGRAEVISLEGIPNPAFDAGDVVRVKRSTLNLDAICVLDTLEIPLSASDAMTLGTRERKLS